MKSSDIIKTLKNFNPRVDNSKLWIASTLDERDFQIYYDIVFGHKIELSISRSDNLLISRTDTESDKFDFVYSNEPINPHDDLKKHLRKWSSMLRDSSHSRHKVYEDVGRVTQLIYDQISANSRAGLNQILKELIKKGHLRIEDEELKKIIKKQGDSGTLLAFVLLIIDKVTDLL
ncbi:MAG: hypothetical protein AAGA64_06380 [Bacteroidota bacterium]